MNAPATKKIKNDDHDNRKLIKLLWGITGSVATVKLPQIIQQLKSDPMVRYDIKVVMTNHGRKMLLEGATERYYQEKTGSSFSEILQSIEIFEDKDEWKESYVVGTDPVLHIELRKWSDVMVIAPLSANTLAKLANGICDNLLTCIARAWDVNKPMLLAPAMNTMMWDHPYTMKHLQQLQTDLKYIHVIQPIVKTLACNDTGKGAMADVKDIIDEMKCIMGKSIIGDEPDMEGKSQQGELIQPKMKLVSTTTEQDDD
jgi:phosphopantothenoylcysteine decarboxylase